MCGGFKCPSTDYCGAHIENPNMGVTSFDNVLVSFLTIFQAITLEGWVDIMYVVFEREAREFLFSRYYYITQIIRISLDRSLIPQKITENQRSNTGTWVWTR